MPDKSPTITKPAAPELTPGVIAVPVRRHPGHRGQDVRDTVAEMAAKAQEISMEAGSKMAAAMKDVIGAAAGYATFALESARDLVQYMVRRGQMTQEEADKLIREAEEAWSKAHKGRTPPARLEQPKKVAPVGAKPVAAQAPKVNVPAKAVANKPAAKKPAAKKPAAKKPAAKKPLAKKPATKKPPAKKPAAKNAHSGKPKPKKPAPKK